MENTSRANFVTVAGWTSPLPEGALLLYLHPIPRPYTYRMQLRMDGRGYKPWVFWISGAGLIAQGIVHLYLHPPGREPGWAAPWLALLSIFVGGQILRSWFHKFLSAVQWTRTQPLNVGVIRTLTIHPRWRDLAFAEAVRADGAVVEVNLSRVIVDDLLSTYGECEVLFLEKPWSWAKKDTGFVIAAREVLLGHNQPSTDPVLHWTSLRQATRLELEQIAQKVDYPIDAVFFVLSALSAVGRLQPDAGEPGRRGDGPGDVRPVTARELCEFIPKHAARMFGDLPRASRVLSAWGLWTGEDVGAIVWACVEAGRLKPTPEDSLDNFQGIELLVGPSPKVHARGTLLQQRRPLKTVWTLLRPSLVSGLSRFCFTLALFVGFVLWAERLTPEERPLVGRWFVMGGKELRLLEFGSDRSCLVRTARWGADAAPGEQNAAGRWIAHDGTILITPPVQSLRGRIAWAFGPDPNGAPAKFRLTDADTLETRTGGPWVVYRRVPAGIDLVDLFSRRPADAGKQRP